MAKLFDNINAKNLVAIILASTICAVILITTTVALFYPPGTVSETFRVKIFEILTFILGIVSGWLLGRGESPKEPPMEKKD